MGKGGPGEQHFVVPANTQPGAWKYCATQHFPSLGHADGCLVVFHLEIGHGISDVDVNNCATATKGSIWKAIKGSSDSNSDPCTTNVFIG